MTIDLKTSAFAQAVIKLHRLLSKEVLETMYNGAPKTFTVLGMNFQLGYSDKRSLTLTYEGGPKHHLRPKKDGTYNVERWVNLIVHRAKCATLARDHKEILEIAAGKKHEFYPDVAVVLDGKCPVIYLGELGSIERTVTVTCPHEQAKELITLLVEHGYLKRAEPPVPFLSRFRLEDEKNA